MYPSNLMKILLVVLEFKCETDRQTYIQADRQTDVVSILRLTFSKLCEGNRIKQSRTTGNRAFSSLGVRWALTTLYDEKKSE
jgi:hypothetical protein